MTQQQIENPIRIGYYWEGEFQPTAINSGVDAGRSQIKSSDTSNPCVVTTQLPHGLSSGKVCIDGHTPNVNINGNQTIVVISSTTFSVTGVAGVENSGVSGIVESVIDASAFTTFTVVVKPSVVQDGLAHPVINLVWVDRSIFSFKLTIAADETDRIQWQSAPLIILVSWLDASNNSDAIEIPIPVINV